MSKAQRRKGNMQTASSAKAAQLLQANGVNIPFIGLESPSLGLSNLLDGEAGLNNVDMPSEFRIVFKKITKRDSLTREKAVKELLDLVKSASQDQIKLSFLYFASVYPKLVTDPGSGIRASVNLVLASYLSNLKKEASNSALQQCLPFLIFSKCDQSNHVVRSADSLLNSCFSEEKRPLVLKNFSKDMANIAQEIVNKKHKLIFPQQFADEETDVQRQARLISQALICLERCLSLPADEQEERLTLTSKMAENFLQTNALGSLMSMPNNVKGAFFLLSKRLISVHPEPFLTSKFPSHLLNQLDSADLSVGRNAFECFLILAKENNFFGYCKLDKSIIPKLLSMVRKKGPHWDILATALLPSVALIYTRIDNLDQRVKFMISLLDSFFDGSLHSVTLSSWTTPFIEICKFFYLKILRDYQTEGLINLIYARFSKFINFVLDETGKDSEIRKLAEFIKWLNDSLDLDGTLDSGISTAHRDALEDCYFQIIQMLPKTEDLLIIFLDLLQSDHQIQYKLLYRHSDLSDQLILKSIQKMGINHLKIDVDELVADISSRISSGLDGNCPSKIVIELLDKLCWILINSNRGRMLNSIINLENYWVCLHLNNMLIRTGLEVDQLLDHEEHFNMVKRIFANVRDDPRLSLVGHSLDYICNHFSQLEIDQFYDSLIEGDLLHKLFAMETILSWLYSNNKISSTRQRILFSKFMRSICEQPERAVAVDQIFPILQKFDCDLADIRSIIDEYIGSAECSPEFIRRIAVICAAIRKYTNTSPLPFLPKKEELLEMSIEIDNLYSMEVLVSYGFLLQFSLLQSHAQINKAPKHICETDPFDHLHKTVKFAFFFGTLISQLRKDNVEDDALSITFIYLLICTKFSSHYKQRTVSSREFKMISEYSQQMEFILEETLSERAVLCSLNFIVHSQTLPFSAFFAIVQLLADKSLDFLLDKVEVVLQKDKSDQFVELIRFAIWQQGTRLRNSNFHFSMLEQFPFTKFGDSPERVQLLRWLAEFELRTVFFTNHNRAENFVALAEFVEQHRASVEDWLFSVQGLDPVKDALSCSMMRFCAEIVPHLAEVGGPIRDFVNCGLITALENCSSSIVRTNAEQKECEIAGSDNQLQFLFGHLCIEMVNNYGNCVKLAKDNPDYVDIRQEWREFFSLLATNHIVHWFVQLALPGNHYWPGFFVRSICRQIHQWDEQLLKVELPPSFTELFDSVKNETNIDSSSLFEGYPSNLVSLLSPAAHLFFYKCSEIQFAAEKIILELLFEMFSAEDKTLAINYRQPASLNDCPPSTSGENNQSLVDEEIPKEQEEDYELEETQIARERQLPRFLKQIFENQQDVFAHFQNPEVDPKLLAWDALIIFLSRLDVLSRVQFCDALHTKLLSLILGYLFDALPLLPGQALCTNFMRVDELFCEHFYQRLIRPFNTEHFTCNLYFNTLVTIPALVREWFTTLSKAQAVAVNKYTQKYVSHLIIRRELHDLEYTRRGRLEVKILPKVREIECTYRLEESAMRLTIKLPDNYPIGSPKVETERSIVSKELHRKWLLQLEMFLNRQNGQMLDGLLQWKRSIDQHLRGVEDCTICMSTVSSTNYQLPKIRCRQCRKRFHGDCLYKWFQTSSMSSCPLCRANFV